MIEITTADHTQLITESVAFMCEILGPAVANAKTISQCVEAFADLLLEDWLDLDTEERIEKTCNADRQVKHLLAADDLLKVDDYGTEAGLY